MYEPRAKIGVRYFLCDRSSSIPAKTATGLSNALACRVALARERQKKKQCKIFARPSKVTCSLFRMMAYLSRQSGLMRFCSLYDEVASNLGANMRLSSRQNGLSN